LAFADPARLATRATSGVLPLSFVIGNGEGRDIEYRYEVRRLDGSSTRVLTSGRTTVVDQTNVHVAAAVRPACRTACRIEIVLDGRSEHLILQVPAAAAVASGHAHG
jgi:hypothetical protein